MVYIHPPGRQDACEQPAQKPVGRGNKASRSAEVMLTAMRSALAADCVSLQGEHQVAYGPEKFHELRDHDSIKVFVYTTYISNP